MYEDGTYLAKNPTWHTQDSAWKASKIAKLIEKNSLWPASLCEIGCGAGEVLNQLSIHLGSSIYFVGYEISPQAFDLCKDKSSANLLFKFADLLQEDNAKFDIVIAIDVFEHVDDYLGFLRKLREKAKYKIFHIPLDLSVQSVLRSSPILKHRRTIGHLHYFTKETALATLRDTGYEIVDYFYTAGSLDLPNRGWKADLLKFPRRLAFRVNADFAVRVLGGYSLMVLAR